MNMGTLIRNIGAALVLMPLLAACGGSSRVNTLTITCSGLIAVAGVSSVEAASTSGGAVALRYSDPVNPGRTGTVPVPPGSSCSIGLTPNVGG